MAAAFGVVGEGNGEFLGLASASARMGGSSLTKRQSQFQLSLHRGPSAPERGTGLAAQEQRVGETVIKDHYMVTAGNATPMPSPNGGAS